MSGLPLALVSRSLYCSNFVIYMSGFLTKKCFTDSSAKSIVWLGQPRSASVPSFFCFLSGMVVRLVGATKGETSLWEGACIHRGGGYIFLLEAIHRETSKLRITVRACREWFLLEILFRVGHLYSSFRDCCFSVLKEENESSLFVFLTWVGSEELLICCCESIVKLG